MIPVHQQSEPVDFETKVRNPGAEFLKRFPSPAKKPTKKDFDKANLWREAKNDLYQAYKGICAYSASWISPRETSVDHFNPKSKRPDLAYEWSNFRLSSERLNNHKGNLEVMDPFNIKFGWFVLDFSTFMINPENNLPKRLKDLINATITCLKLNDDNDLVQARLHLVQEFVDNQIPFDFLKERYPFIAFELERQGLKEAIKIILKKSSP